MAVAAADFYTYARATGTPLPQSKKEEAQLAPAVDKWKKSRLSNTTQEEKGIDAGKVAGLTAIGAAALAAFNPNARRNLLNFVDKIPPNTETVTRDQSGQLVRGRPKPGTATSTNVGGIQQDLNVEPVTWDDVKQRSTPNYEVVEKGGAGVRSDFTQPVVEQEVKTFSPYDFIVEQKSVDPETAYVTQRLRELQTGPKALESLADEQIDVIRGTVANPKIYPETTSEIRRQNARARAVLTEEADLVRKELLSDQSVNAIDAAEDQETGRVVRQLQRNEDIDQNAVAIGEEQFEAQGIKTDPIDAVAQSLPDGPPVIQSEQRVGLSAQPTAQEFLEQTKLEKLSQSPIAESIAMERDEIVSQMGEMGITKPKPSIVETELSRRLGKESYLYGPSYTQLKNQIKLGSEDPRFLTNLDQETKYVGGVELPIAVRNVFDNTATGSRQIKEPYIKPELAQKADLDYRQKISNAQDWSGKARLEIHQQLNPLIKQTDELLEEQNMLLWSLNNQGSNRELAQRLGLVNKELKENQNNINYLQGRLDSVADTKERWIGGIKKWTPTTLTDWKGEGTVVRPKPQLARNKELITDEGDSLTSLNQATQRVTDVGPEDLEIVPGGLLTGGYPKAITNVPKTNIYTGAVENPLKIASGTSIRGMGGIDLDNQYVPLIKRGTGGEVAIKGERSFTQGGNILPNTGAAKNVPSGSLISYRKPAGEALSKDLNIAVTGGRKYDNYTELSQSLDRAINQLNPTEGTNINIIAGGAKGADALAERYAKERNYGLTVKPADWDQYDKAAGPIRNREMAELADVGVAFEGGTGTQNMIKTMQEQGKPVLDTAEIQQPTAAMRGKSGTRVVNISENIRHLSDPNWLASQGYNLNKVSPQQLVGEYLQQLQSKTGNADLQEYIQTTRKRFK